MAVSLGSVVLNVSNVGRAAEFWSKALGYVPQPDDPAFLASENGEGPRLHLDETDRTHLHLWVNQQASDQQTEVERLISLGATRVDWDYPPDADFVVLADPRQQVCAWQHVALGVIPSRSCYPAETVGGWWHSRLYVRSLPGRPAGR